jgi:hypothetical protein
MIWTNSGNHGGGGVVGESPFDKYAEKKSVILYLEPVLNTYYQQYVNILTLSGVPGGSLRELVYTIQSSRLSTFQQSDWMSCDSCIFVLGRYPGIKPTMNHMNTFMMADDIPSVISYLREHGYTVDTNITEMLQNSGVIGGSSPCRGNRKMVCMFS